MSTPPVSPAEEAGEDLLGSAAAGPVALRGGALRGFTYALTIALSLVSVPLLIRHLGIARFGDYSTVVALTAIVAGVTDAGLMNIGVREWVTRSGEERRRILRSLLGIRLELSLAGVAIGVGFALVAGYRNVLVLGTLLAGIGWVFQALVHVLSVPLQGSLRFGRFAMIDLSRQVVAVALIVVLVLVGAGLLPLLAVTIPSGLVMVLIAAVLVRRQMPLVPSYWSREWWPLVRDTLPYSAAFAISLIYLRVTIVVMSLITTAQQTGYFATAFRIVDVLTGFPQFAVAAGFPILSRASTSDQRRFAYASERMIELALIAGAGLALAVVLSAPFVIKVIAGHNGAPAVSVLQIQALTLMATFVVVATAYSLLALRRHLTLLLANGTALVTNVVLTIVLVNADHARGGAIACLIVESLLAITQLVLLLRTRRTRIRPSTIAVVAVAGAAGASLLLIGGFQSVPRTFAGLVIYIGVVTLLRRFPPEVADALRLGHRRDASTS